MIIQTLLDETRASVISKLISGNSNIISGTVRDSVTGKYTAQIPVAGILKESELTRNLINASLMGNPYVAAIKGGLDIASNVYSHIQLHQIQQTLDQVMSLQQLTLGINAIGFALVLYKLNKMDKKLDKIIQCIEELKKENFKIHLDKLKAGITRIQKHDLYNEGQKDKDFDSQLNQITDSLDFLKQYFERHTMFHNNEEIFYDYLFLVVLCHLVQFKIDSIKEQNNLAKDSLNSAIKLIENYSSEYITLNPKFSANTNKYLLLKRRIKDYFFEFQYDQDIKNKIIRNDVKVFELDYNETIEVFKKLTF